MSYLWWLAGIAVCIYIYVLLRHPRVAPDTTPVLVDMEIKKTRPSDHIQVFRATSPGEYQCLVVTDERTLMLYDTTAVQIHRYTAPIKGCSCNCVKSGPESYERYELNTKNGDIFVFTDKQGVNAEYDLRATHKLHALLRPDGCSCRCLPDGIAVFVHA
jgi:hypothetical protein